MVNISEQLCYSYVLLITATLNYRLFNYNPDKFCDESFYVVNRVNMYFIRVQVTNNVICYVL
jgi:hypothetical protein